MLLANSSSININLNNIKMSKLNIKPLADRVVIEAKASETKTASGIYIPDSAKEKPQEGKVVAVVPADKADEVLQIMRQHSAGQDSAIIAEISEAPAGRVVLKTKFGGDRIVDMLVGEQLPRIC